MNATVAAVASPSASEPAGAAVRDGAGRSLLSAVGLAASDFELFGLPERFSIDPAVLDARWKSLQREVHPDRFAAEGPAAQRVAMQWSVRVNEAYQRLKNPVRRAAYLCERAGQPVDAESNTAMPAAFLLQQMQWREALEEARTEAELQELAQAVRHSRQAHLQQLAQWLDPVAPAERPDPAHAARAVEVVRALLFIDRFASDVQQRLDAWHG